MIVVNKVVRMDVMIAVKLDGKIACLLPLMVTGHGA
jgi:hypothetical protein